METKEINIHSPAHSTFPVQDQFNQVHMFTGLSKLEWMSGMIASNVKWDHIIPDGIDKEIKFITTLAKKILRECDSHKPEVKSPLTKI